MKKQLTGQEIQQTILEVIKDKASMGEGYLQQFSTLKSVAKRLDIQIQEHEEALLTFWQDLFRTGRLSWGANLSNPDPPFFHVTELGRKTLSNLSRDPANPDGYLAYIEKIGIINPIAHSYLKEALKTYNSDCYKATAVMLGAATECLVNDLRNVLIAKITICEKKVSKELKDWRMKFVLDGIYGELKQQKDNMARELYPSVEAHWPAFLYQIRTARNEAGHPNSIEPVTVEIVHAGLLIFPELAKLTKEISRWIEEGYK